MQHRLTWVLMNLEDVQLAELRLNEGKTTGKWPEAPSPMRLNLQNLKLVAIQPQNDDSLWQVNASERRSPRAIRTMMSKISGGRSRKRVVGMTYTSSFQQIPQSEQIYTPVHQKIPTT
ncbi:hypothetical protein BDZ89DRAFT_1044065 [Hymenopellis radicata]|nr:hypothetical protein BDZ89DRAFT_1044065 [Hymenopellis radicata]